MNEFEEIKNPEGTTATEGASQFLTFSLADEEYGIDILKVQEIKGYSPTTRLPNSPAEVIGVLNLRGTVVPVVDLRRRFRLPEAQYDQFTVIVVVVVQDQIMGVVVDSVSEVVNILPPDIQAPPSGGSASANVLQGVAQVGDKLVILLDIDAVLLDSTAINVAA